MLKRTLKQNERNKMNAVLLRSPGKRVGFGRPLSEYQGDWKRKKRGSVGGGQGASDNFGKCPVDNFGKVHWPEKGRTGKGFPVDRPEIRCAEFGPQIGPEGIEKAPVFRPGFLRRLWIRRQAQPPQGEQVGPRPLIVAQVFGNVKAHPLTTMRPRRGEWRSRMQPEPATDRGQTSRQGCTGRPARAGAKPQGRRPRASRRPPAGAAGTGGRQGEKPRTPEAAPERAAGPGEGKPRGGSATQTAGAQRTGAAQAAQRAAPGPTERNRRGFPQPGPAHRRQSRARRGTGQGPHGAAAQASTREAQRRATEGSRAHGGRRASETLRAGHSKHAAPTGPHHRAEDEHEPHPAAGGSEAGHCTAEEPPPGRPERKPPTRERREGKPLKRRGRGQEPPPLISGGGRSFT